MRNNQDFPSMRQLAKDPSCPVSEHTLRLMLKSGELDGFYVGTHYRVDRAALMAKLKAKSAEQGVLV